MLDYYAGTLTDRDTHTKKKYPLRLIATNTLRNERHSGELLNRGPLRRNPGHKKQKFGKQQQQLK